MYIAWTESATNKYHMLQMSTKKRKGKIILRMKRVQSLKMRNVGAPQGQGMDDDDEKTMTTKKTIMKTMTITTTTALEIGQGQRGRWATYKWQAINVWWGRPAGGVRGRRWDVHQQSNWSRRRKFGSLAQGLQCPQSNGERMSTWT